MPSMDGVTEKPNKFVATAAIAIPAMMPIIPPIIQITIDYTIKCVLMELLVAPRAFLVPISRVRSVMDTSIIFMTPIPPTRSEIPAITEIAREIVDTISVREESMLSMLEVEISKSSLFR